MEEKLSGQASSISALRFQYKKGLATHAFETIPFYLKVLRGFLWKNRGKCVWLKGGIIEQPAYLIFHSSIKQEVIEMLSQPLADLGRFTVMSVSNPIEIAEKYVNQQRVALGWLKLPDFELGSAETVFPPRTEEEITVTEKVQQGFMLGKNIFIKADGAYEVMVPRKEYYGVVEKPMLVLLNAVELTIDQKGKIVAVEQHDKFGIWKEFLK